MLNQKKSLWHYSNNKNFVCQGLLKSTQFGASLQDHLDPEKDRCHQIHPIIYQPPRAAIVSWDCKCLYPRVNSHSLQWKDPPFFMGKSTISMAIFNCKLLVHQRVIHPYNYLGKLSYFTNLNLAAIWGWFPAILTMIPGLGRTVRSL